MDDDFAVRGAAIMAAGKLGGSEAYRDETKRCILCSVNRRFIFQLEPPPHPPARAGNGILRAIK